METLTVQAHVDGHWHDAATIDFADPEIGIRGPSKIVYDDDYIFDLVLANSEDWVIDRRALSVNCPASLEDVYLDRWPPWLLDLMPQGVARERIAKDLSLPRNAPELDMQLLLRAGGTPIGNLRIKEAWELETERLKGIWCPPISDQDIANKSDIFLDVVDRYAHLASGSSGVQGEWPKALMTRSKTDGQWYPDPFVATENVLCRENLAA